LTNGGELPATVLWFRAPHSYTRQDSAEIHTIGSPAVLEVVRCRAIEFGAVTAQPGEFTARAFLNGAMSLSQAEAVAGVIRAQSDTQLRAARRLMDGAVARAVTQVRDELAELLALVEADIDFAEEPIEFITPAALVQRLGVVDAGLKSLLVSAASIERLDALPRILLFGRPNAGKSSLMNRLSGTARSICAAVAGTTRDLLSAPIRVGRGEAILLDSAGVDESDDAILSQARELVLSAADRVDLVCVVIDVTNPEDERVHDLVRSLKLERAVVAVNKSDLVGLPEAVGGIDETAARELRDRLTSWGLGPVCSVSAATGAGVEALRDQLAAMLGTLSGTTSGESVWLTERQRVAIAEAAGSIARAIDLSRAVSETIDCADLLAFELREALETLGSVTGEVTTDELLDQVFARFCIGK